jgi:cytidine diphosphoramidate kinase
LDGLGFIDWQREGGLNDGKVIWITGLSGAGKTTLAKALVDELSERTHPVLVDGDQIRELFASDLGFDEASRRVQIGRIQRLAKWLSDQGHMVVVAALYSHPDLLAWNRQNLRGYFEVYLDLPLSEVRKRDSKGLYTAALGGDLINVVGVDIRWLAPERPDFVFDTNSIAEPRSMARKLISVLSDPPICYPAAEVRARVGRANG